MANYDITYICLPQFFLLFLKVSHKQVLNILLKYRGIVTVKASLVHCVVLIEMFFVRLCRNLCFFRVLRCFDISADNLRHPDYYYLQY